MASVIGSIGAAVIGGLMQNKYNMDAQEDVQDFQKWMFEHRYRLQMEDMQKAGLNPMLSYTQGPPGPPSGGGSSGASPDLVGALSTATQMKRTDSELQTQEAQRQLMLTQGAQNVANTDLASQQAAKTAAEIQKIREEVKSASAKAQIDNANAQQRTTLGQRNVVTDAMDSLRVMGDNLRKSLGVVSETPKRQAERELPRSGSWGPSSYGLPPESQAP